MRLHQVIAALEAADPNHVSPIGIGEPHSWRGRYDCVAFEPVANISVRDMLANAKSALHATFEGYKGGEFFMTEATECYLDSYGCYDGDMLGPVLMSFMTGKFNQDPGKQ